MQNLSNDNIFLFYEDSSQLKIVPNSLEHAYLSILNDDLENAYIIFSKNNSPRGMWGEILISILSGVLTKFPTFFQIRNFFEIDLDFLLKNGKIDYVESLLGSMEVLSTVNQEIYKYAARAMYENKLFSASLKYMEKAKKTFYNDAELHFMLSKYYIRIKDYENAMFCLKTCTSLVPGYYPAKLLIKKIDELTE